MSLHQNEDWISAAKETFDMGVESGDYETCKMVIDDTFDKGFVKESLVLEQLLLASPLDKFTNPTHEFLWK